MNKQFWIGLGAVVLVLGVGFVGLSNQAVKLAATNQQVLGQLIQALQSEKHLGAFISSGSNLTDLAVANDVTVGNNLTVTGATTLTGPVTISSSTPNNPYIITVTLNSGNTSSFSSQTYSGPTVAVDSYYFTYGAANSSNTTNTVFRAYLSKLAGDSNTNATGTLFRQSTINTSSLLISYGGPVQSSYYTSSTIPLLGNGLQATSTPIMMYNGDVINTTGTAALTLPSGSSVKLFVHAP